MKKNLTLFITTFWIFVASASFAQVPTSNLKLWLDASNPYGNNTTPADGTLIDIWADVSGAANNASRKTDQVAAVFKTNQINGKPTLRFTRGVDQFHGSVYVVNGVDIKPASMPKLTIFTVYRQASQLAHGDQAIWGDDDGGWDRFFFSSFPNYAGDPSNGGVSQGTYATVVQHAGDIGKTQLLTAVYNNSTIDPTAANKSAIYFNGKLKTNFSDQTATGATAARNTLFIGWDGDDNSYDGDIAEMLVYDRVLTDCEIQQVNEYLSTKYGTTFTSVDITPSGPLTFTQGGSVTLTATVTGTSYRWFKDGNVIPAATSQSYTATSSGNYKVEVTNGCAATSGAQTVVVNQLTTIAGSTTAANITAGTSVVADANVAVTSTQTIPGARVAITGNFTAGDALAYTGVLPGGITSSYNATTGILSFSGNGTQAQYQAILAAVTFSSSASVTASTRTIQFSLGDAIANPSNGHFYEYISTTGSWSAAKTAAAARNMLGMQGYLATITSATENAFITAKLSANGWLGGSDEYTTINAATGAATYASQATSEGHFYWVTGPEAGTIISNGNRPSVTAAGGAYMNWASNQPDNFNGLEHYMEIYSSTTPAGTWNDLAATDVAGYVVEYGGLSIDPTGSVLSYSRTLNLGASNPVVPVSGGNVTVTYNGLARSISATAASGSTVDWYDAATNGNKVATGTSASTTTTYSQTAAGTYTYYAEARDNTSGLKSTSRVQVTLTINKAPLIATPDNQTKAYGAANPTLTAGYTGFVNNETSAVLTTAPTITTTATATSPVGTYAITASGAVADNYTISYAPGTLVVTPAALTITANNQTKTYGAANPTLTAGYTGFVNNETSAVLTTAPTVITIATPASPVGTYAITGSGAAAANYTISYAPGILAVTPAALTITANSQTKAYGAAIPALSVGYTGFVNNETSAVLTTTPTVSTTATATSPVGTYATNASGAAAANYTISYVPGSLIVSSATLTITAANQTKVYGTANPALTLSYAGFVNGDTQSSLTTQPTAVTSATTASGAGNYTITASGAASNNYVINYAPGTLTVTKAALTITADDKTREYGAANPAFTFTYSGFVNGDNASSLTTQAVGSTSAGASSAPGNYQINVNGATSSNYTIAYVGGRLTVTPLHNADLSKLTTGPGTLSPSFSSSIYYYTTSVGNEVTTYSLNAYADPTASVKINGASTGNNGPLFTMPLNVGYNTATIVVTAQDGTTVKTYVITVYRAVDPVDVTATNILTPNGDGKNDNWVVKDILLYPNNTVTVYDRGGRVIYTKHAYANDWNGTLNGEPLVEGTYFYIIELGPGLGNKKGYITILRRR